MPAIPDLSVPPTPKSDLSERPYELPTIPLPTLPMRPNEEKSPTPSTSSLPGTPGLPPIPDFIGGSDLAPIPPSPAIEKK